MNLKLEHYVQLQWLFQGHWCAAAEHFCVWTHEMNTTRLPPEAAWSPKASKAKEKGFKVSTSLRCVVAGLNSSDILVFYFLYIICCYQRWNHSSLLPNVSGATGIIYSVFYQLFQVFQIVSPSLIAHLLRSCFWAHSFWQCVISWSAGGLSHKEN